MAFVTTQARQLECDLGCGAFVASDAVNRCVERVPFEDDGAIRTKAVDLGWQKTPKLDRWACPACLRSLGRTPERASKHAGVVRVNGSWDIAVGIADTATDIGNRVLDYLNGMTP